MDISLQIKVGLRIREIRLEKRVTQQELADLCGYEISNMSRLEAGRANATLVTIETVSKALGIEAIELFKFKNSPPD